MTSSSAPLFKESLPPAPLASMHRRGHVRCDAMHLPNTWVTYRRTCIVGALGVLLRQSKNNVFLLPFSSLSFIFACNVTYSLALNLPSQHIQCLEQWSSLLVLESCTDCWLGYVVEPGCSGRWCCLPVHQETQVACWDKDHGPQTKGCSQTLIEAPGVTSHPLAALCFVLNYIWTWLHTQIIVPLWWRWRGEDCWGFPFHAWGEQHSLLLAYVCDPWRFSRREPFD